jgi:hypothetical protein
VTSDGEPTPKRRRKRWPYLVGVVAFLIAAGAIVYEPLVRKIVRKRALAAGVDLHCRDIRYRFSAATVGACRATLLGADGIELVLETAVVDLAGMSPTAVHARNAVVTLDATFPTLLSSLNEWRRRYPTLTSLPLDGEIISIVWRRPHPGWNATVSLPRAAMDPELRAGEIDGARVAVTAEGTEPTKQPTLRLDGITGSWRDDRIKLGVGIVDLQLASTDAAKPRRVMLGPIAASWDGERAGIDLGLGGPDAKNPPIRLELERAKRRVVVAVPEQELDWLTSPFGVSIPVRGVRASSRVEIALGEDPWRGEIGGSLSARVAGWLPAHPAEIDGFLRGDGIGVTADAKLAADRQSVQLPRVDVAIGAIALRGRGDVRREGNDARLSLSLRGRLSCVEIADAVARRRFPPEIGGIVARVLDASIVGEVAFGADIDATTRDLAATRIKPVIVLGCGLKALERLLPDLVSELAKELPPLPLPPLPLPPVPKLPKFPLP